MPHVNRVEVDGIVIPSVNTITGSLSKEGLDRWKEKYQIQAVEALTKAKPSVEKALAALRHCDTVRDESAGKGTEITKLFEDIAKGLEVDVPEQYQRYVDSFLNWQAKHSYLFVAVEPHLINPVDMYHGSPDAVGHPANKPLEMLDYKVKRRGVDWKVLLNESAYIRAWGVVTGQLINTIRIVTFHPETAKPHEQVFENDPQYFNDFLTCYDQYAVNKRAEQWFNKYCKYPLKG